MAKSVSKVLIWISYKFRVAACRFMDAFKHHISNDAVKKIHVEFGDGFLFSSDFGTTRKDYWRNAHFA